MQGTLQHWLAYLPIFAVLVGPAAIATWFAYQLHRERVLRRRDGSDYLTGLPTRRAAAAVAAQAMSDARHSGNEFAVIVLNVDRLKPINDSLGHQAGDEVVAGADPATAPGARRMTTCWRDWPAMSSPSSLAACAVLATPKTSCSRFSRWCRQPFTVAGTEIHTSVTMGVSMYPVDGDSFDLLLRRAETALRCAKEASRGSYRFYALEMSNAAEERLSLETDLRRAVETGTVRAALPAEGGHRHQSHSQRRGADPLASSDARAGTAERLHSHRGRNRVDRAHRRMGAARGLPAGARLDRFRNVTGAHCGEPVGETVPSRRPGGGGAFGARRSRTATRLSGTGADRERDHGRRRKIRRDAAGSSAPWACTFPSTTSAPAIPA